MISCRFWAAVLLAWGVPCTLFFVFRASAGDVPQVAGEASRFDGPAELPRVHVKSRMSDTPAPGHTRLVREGDRLQQVIDSANCGDTLQLQAGATFRGQYNFPEKPCDDGHWIVVRT